MDSQDPRSAVSGVLRILRKLTRCIQILPFAYLILYAVVLLTEPFESDAIYEAIGSVAYAPLSGIAFLLFLGRMLKLCVWHKAACLIPVSSRVTDFIDNYILQFTQGEVIIINTVLGVACLLFVILAIRHFAHGK